MYSTCSLAHSKAYCTCSTQYTVRVQVLRTSTSTRVPRVDYSTKTSCSSPYFLSLGTRTSICISCTSTYYCSTYVLGSTVRTRTQYLCRCAGTYSSLHAHPGYSRLLLQKTVNPTVTVPYTRIHVVCR